MTVVIGQHFFEGIVMIGDSRASLRKKDQFVPWRDIVQKIFFLTPNLIIGFAGDIEFAGAVIPFLVRAIESRPRLGLLHVFASKAPKLIKHAYDQLVKETGRTPDVAFIIAGIDFTRPAPAKDANGKITGYLAIYDKKVFKVASPSFAVENTSFETPFVVIGSGEPGMKGLEKTFHDLMFGQSTGGLDFQAALMQITLNKSIKELGITTVGGLYQIAIIDNRGPRFQTYKGKREPFKDGVADDELDVELYMRDGRFIQRDLKTGREVPILLPPEVLKINDSTRDLFTDLDN